MGEGRAQGKGISWGIWWGSVGVYMKRVACGSRFCIENVTMSLSLRNVPLPLPKIFPLMNVPFVDVSTILVCPATSSYSIVQCAEEMVGSSIWMSEAATRPMMRGLSSTHGYTTPSPPSCVTSRSCPCATAIVELRRTGRNQLTCDTPAFQGKGFGGPPRPEALALKDARRFAAATVQA